MLVYCHVNSRFFLVGGFSPTPLKNDGVKVSWDDEIPNIWEVIKFMFQTTNQLSYYPPAIHSSFGK